MSIIWHVYPPLQTVWLTSVYRLDAESIVFLSLSRGDEQSRLGLIDLSCSSHAKATCESFCLS
jgi:hypothetical protein